MVIIDKTQPIHLGSTLMYFIFAIYNFSKKILDEFLNKAQILFREIKVSDSHTSFYGE